MEGTILDWIGTLWPIVVGIAVVVYQLIKISVDLESLKQNHGEKIKTLFDLWNSRDKK
tara:strand:- start:494 stop:667 length:174 start_codon:yes stop_codon:yes gene_type:complete